MMISAADFFLLSGCGSTGISPTVVDHTAPAVGEQGHLDAGRLARHRLVDGVVDDLVHEMVEPRRPGRPDVHPGAFTDRLEPLEDRDVLRGVARLLLRGWRPARVRSSSRSRRCASPAASGVDGRRRTRRRLRRRPMKTRASTSWQAVRFLVATDFAGLNARAPRVSGRRRGAGGGQGEACRRWVQPRVPTRSSSETAGQHRQTTRLILPEGGVASGPRAARRRRAPCRSHRRRRSWRRGPGPRTPGSGARSPRPPTRPRS